MRFPIFRRIVLIGMILTMLIPTVEASYSKPRRQKKRRANKEEVEVKQDSIVTDMVIDSSLVVVDEPIIISDPEPVVRVNTPQQIDSVLAMWQRTSTQKAYDDYFNDMLAVSERIDTLYNATDVDSIYIERMQALLSPVPLKYNYEVRKAIERYTSKHYEESMGYAYYYFPMIEAEFIKVGIPVELRTLAFVESNLNALAKSKAGAAGIWQFMPETGKVYGLEINSLVDERCNPLLATRAAAKYLKSMYEQYGDWTLAIASYNTGPRNVNKAIIRCGGELSNYKGSFWDIYDHLAAETRTYVPLYMGATYAFAYHKAHGMNLVMPPLPLATDIVMVDRPMHLEQVSSTINVDIEVLKMLNPQYTMMIIPATSKEYMLTLPAELISEYWANEEAIHAKDAEYLKEFVVHANLEKKRAEAPPAQYHTVKKGETLGAIAKKYGRTIKQLMSWNNIKNADAIREGQKLRVSPK